MSLLKKTLYYWLFGTLCRERTLHILETVFCRLIYNKPSSFPFQFLSEKGKMTGKYLKYYDAHQSSILLLKFKLQYILLTLTS